MDRNGFLDWARAMLEGRVGAPVTQQSNNVQSSRFAPGVGIGIVGNIQLPEIRVHLFTYDAARGARWRSARTVQQIEPVPEVGAPGHRTGDKRNVEYLEFSWPVTWPATPGPAEHSLQRRVTACVDYFVAARSQELIP